MTVKSLPNDHSIAKQSMLLSASRSIWMECLKGFEQFHGMP
jgi:hypothetical protein